VTDLAKCFSECQTRPKLEVIEFWWRSELTSSFRKEF